MSKKTISIAFFGTSITEHPTAVSQCLKSQLNLLNVGEYAKVTHHTKSGYVKLFENMVKAQFPEVLVEISNYGISGGNIFDIKNKAQSVVDKNKRFDFVYIEAGLNDLFKMHLYPKQGVPMHKFAEEHYQTLLLLKKLSKHVNVMYSTPFSKHGITGQESLDTYSLNLSLNNYNLEVGRNCERIKGQLINNNYPIMVLETEGLLPFCDGIHLNELGDMSIALNIFKQWCKDVTELNMCI